MVSSQGYTAMAYTFAVVFAVAVAIYAFVKGYLLRQKIADTESFLTARGQVGWYRVAWSFYAGAVGAWVITSPAGYASFAGMLGLCMYSLAAGLPFLMIAYGGDVIRKRLPHVCSLTDFMGYRYGEMTKAVVCLIILFNMSIALLAEYYTIGLIFRYFVRSVPYAMVIVVGMYRCSVVGEWANAMGTCRRMTSPWLGSLAPTNWVGVLSSSFAHFLPHRHPYPHPYPHSHHFAPSLARFPHPVLYGIRWPLGFHLHGHHSRNCQRVLLLHPRSLYGHHVQAGNSAAELVHERYNGRRRIV